MYKGQIFLKPSIFITVSLQRVIAQVLGFLVKVKLFLQIRLGKEAATSSSTNMHKPPSHWKQSFHTHTHTHTQNPACKGLSEYLLTATSVIYILVINPISWVISFPFYWWVNTTELGLNPGLQRRAPKPRFFPRNSMERNLDPTIVGGMGKIRLDFFPSIQPCSERLLQISNQKEALEGTTLN